MSKNNNVIEINGKRYDSSTGELLDVMPKSKPIHSAAKLTPEPTVVAPSKTQTTHQKTAHQAATHAQHHQPQTAKTLMRSSVKKPSASHATKLKAHTGTDVLIKPTHAQVPAKLSVAHINASRLRHAKNITQSKLVRRFSPTAFVATPLAPETLITPTSVPHEARQIVQPAQTTSELLRRAVEQADSHHQPIAKTSRNHRDTVVRRIVGISAAATAFVLLVGVIGYQSSGNVRLHLASSRAGFAASLPSHRPAGYSLGAVNSNAGIVAAQFHSNANDSRNFTVTEKASDWDSATLRDSFVAANDQQYQTATSGGHIVYLYGNGNATWVSNGVWYILSSNGALSNQQLLDTASSL